MHKFSFCVKNYAHKACNPTFLNVSISKRQDKFRIFGLQA